MTTVSSHRACGIAAALVAVVVVGLSGREASRSAAPYPSPVTFADVAPLLFDRCVQCHHPNGPAPFSLTTYASARARATLITSLTTRRVMPPWKSGPSTGPFLGQTPLSDREIALLQQWVSDGALEGDPARLPKPSWTDGWQLGTPDLVVQLPAPYTLAASGGDVWRVFVLPVPLESMRYVRGLEFRPGNMGVVHHARIRIDPTAASRELDARDPAPGYDGLILRSAVYPDGHFLGWTPGQAGPMLPEGLAWRLAPQSSLVMEVHMVPSGKVEAVQPSVGLFFSAEPPQRTPAILRLGRKDLDIAPGDRGYVSADAFVLPVDVELLALQPHAHARARRVVARATWPDGARRTLLEIDDWDVRWQHLYQLVRPLVLPKGTRLEMQFTFDNSAENPRNPQLPPRRVEWGEESTSEMGELWLQLLTARDRDLRTLNAAIGPKMVAEDILGYEYRLRADPAKIALHDEAGDAYLLLGRAAEAIPHFEASLRARPESASAHYNLGVALASAGRLDDAMRHFRRAIEIRPDYAVAHNNLGNLLTRAGRHDEALAQFSEAIRLDPKSADAHYNAGVVLRSRGHVAEAIERFRSAVTLDPEWTAAISNLAWLLATAPAEHLRRPPEAIRLAGRAADLTERRDASVLDVLAAAHAADGDFVRALAVVDEALALASTEVVAAVIRQRQTLYRQHRPYVSR